jgi:putative membrane protein
MNSNFSKPQRQSLIGVVIMFADTLQGTLRALWPILVVWLFKINQVTKLYLYIGVPAVLILLAVIAYLKYLNFSFFLDEENEEFVVRKGVFNKSRIAISLDKIQQVNINQSFIQRLIGVHALEVDTAGSNGKEVSIRAIKHDLALSLKARLMQSGRQDAASGNNDITDEQFEQETQRPFIKISLLSLLKTGITSNYVRSFAVLLAFMITIFQNLEEFLNASGYTNHLDEYINRSIMMQFITVIITTIILMTLVVNLVRTLIRYYNFRITKQHNSLLLSYGLLNTKNTIIRPEKVQVVTIGRNYFQKKFNINDIKVKQASGNEANNGEQKKTAIEIPGCDNNERNLLLEFLLGKVPERGIMIKPNLRKMIFQSVKFLIFPIVISTVVFMSDDFSVEKLMEFINDVKVFALIYLLFAVLMVYFGFKNSRLFVNNDFIIKQSGAWDIDNDFIAPHKIQTISLKQFFWQKWSDVGIVTLHTAGGTISFGLANYTTLKQLANYWLYQVETTNKHWM